MTAILRFFLRPDIGAFSPHFGAISLFNSTENPLEQIKDKSSGDGAPKLQISCPCHGRTRPDCLRERLLCFT